MPRAIFLPRDFLRAALARGRLSVAAKLWEPPAAETGLAVGAKPVPSKEERARGRSVFEAALAGVPQVACYRANGSEISYKIMRKLLSVDYVTLPNLILDREAIAEKLLHLCTPETVAEALSPLTSLNSGRRARMLEDYLEMRSRLGTGDAADNTAAAIIDDLLRRKQ